MSVEVFSPHETGLAIAIDGPGGAGKSTIGEKILEFYGGDPERQLLHIDNYFEPSNIPGVESVPGAPGGYNFARFMRQVGEPINNSGLPMRSEEYSWDKPGYIELPDPDQRQLVVVEGIKLIGLPVNWGVQVWIDTPRELRQERFLKRATQERRMKETDPAVLLERFNRWADDADVYEAMINPHGRPDVVVVPGTASRTEQFDMIAPAIQAASTL